MANAAHPREKISRYKRDAVRDRFSIEYSSNKKLCQMEQDDSLGSYM